MVEGNGDYEGQNRGGGESYLDGRDGCKPMCLIKYERNDVYLTTHPFTMIWSSNVMQIGRTAKVN